MFLIVMCALAVFTTSAHAEPGKPGDNTRRLIEQRLKALGDYIEQLKCEGNDPLKLIPVSLSAGGISEFASITERIESFEMNADPSAFVDAARMARSAVSELNDMRRLYDKYDNSPVTIEFGSVKDMLKINFEKIKSMLESKTFPLSLKGPLEKIAASDMREIPLTVLVDAEKFYEERIGQIKVRLFKEKECPSLLAERKRYRKMYGNIPKAILIAEAKVEAASAALKKMSEELRRIEENGNLKRSQVEHTLGQSEYEYEVLMPGPFRIPAAVRY